MTSNSLSKRPLEALLSALTSRLGIATVVGFFVGGCIGLGQYVGSVVEHIEQNNSVFDNDQIRNGYTALSDLQRLTEISKQAVAAGEMTPQLAERFNSAVDMLYVRTDMLDRMRMERQFLPSGNSAITALEQVVLTADQAAQIGFRDIDELGQNLADSAELARLVLVSFLKDIRGLVEKLLAEQTDAVRKQETIVISTLAGLTMVVCLALLSLRREVIGRQARADAEQRVEYLAFYDPLTELPNRIQFHERLQALLNQKHPIALLFIDLDDFKVVNDTHGHAAGDAVLRHVGIILAKLAEKSDGFAARLAGDEFAMVVPEISEQLLHHLCRNLLKIAAKPVLFEGETLSTHLSIGLATTKQVSLQSDVTLDMMTRVADFALYESKTKGRDRYTFYNDDLERRFFERRALLEELPLALTNKDLEIHLQPKVHLSNRHVYGFEALVRWRRNGRLIPPAKFITLAEESGLVPTIDTFVLQGATALIADWNAEMGTDYSMSVNLSALNFNSNRIVSIVEMALWNSGLAPGKLTLEITETLEMRDWKQANETIEGLRALGCKIAIDDFGTGFSSLAYLRATKADELKVDRSLIVELETSQDSRLLLSSVFDIARNLKMQITIEGIETVSQAEIVESLGTANAQGYLFGRPQPPNVALVAAIPEQDAPSAHSN